MSSVTCVVSGSRGASAVIVTVTDAAVGMMAGSDVGAGASSRLVVGAAAGDVAVGDG